MSLHEAFCDRQTEAGSVSRGPRCVHSEESLKDALMIFRAIPISLSETVKPQLFPDVQVFRAT
jgi:hypothetical protein